MIDRPYHQRRRQLEALVEPGPSWAVIASFDDPPAVFIACVQLGLEGIVAKREASRYEPGRRSPHWRKRTTAAWQTEHALAGGRAGGGHRSVAASG